VRQEVMTKIEHAKFLQAANLLGHIGQNVFSQHQSFEFRLLPYGLRNTTQLFFPQAQARRRIPHEYNPSAFGLEQLLLIAFNDFLRIEPRHSCIM